MTSALCAAFLWLVVPAVSLAAPVQESDLVGDWHSESSNLVALQVSYAADHHYTLRCVGVVTGSMTGSWRLVEGQIITKWTGGELTSLVNQKKIGPDGSEKREKIVALEANNLVTRGTGDETRPTRYARGTAPGMEVADKPMHFPTAKEKYDRAIKTLAAAKKPKDCLDALGPAAKQCLLNGDFPQARADAEELLALARKFRADPASAGLFHDDANYDDALEDGNMILGRCVLREGKSEEAEQALLASTEVPGCTSTSFGPNMCLAKELLERGRRDAVLAYFRRCRTFWDHGPLDGWIAEVETGKIPEFGANLKYGFD